MCLALSLSRVCLVGCLNVVSLDLEKFLYIDLALILPIAVTSELVPPSVDPFPFPAL